MLDTAATTEGSSTTMGMSTSSPLTRKFTPTPRGSPKVPTTFSTMRSAVERERARASKRGRSASVSSVRAITAARRSAGGNR